MSDADLLSAAMSASGITDPRSGEPSLRGFSRRLLRTDDAKLRKVLAGTASLGHPSAVVCMLVVMRPDLTEAIELAAAQVAAERALAS